MSMASLAYSGGCLVARPRQEGWSAGKGLAVEDLQARLTAKIASHNTGLWLNGQHGQPTLGDVLYRQHHASAHTKRHKNQLQRNVIGTSSFFPLPNSARPSFTSLSTIWR